SAIEDQIVQNEKLFKRIEAVYQSPEKQKLNAEQQRLVWLYYNNFVRAGAKLDVSAKKRLGDINQELAKLFTQFRINVLKDETNEYVVIERESDLKGLPESLISSAASEAEAKGLPGKWVITNTRSSVDPFLQF